MTTTSTVEQINTPEYKIPDGAILPHGDTSLAQSKSTDHDDLSNGLKRNISESTENRNTEINDGQNVQENKSEDNELELHPILLEMINSTSPLTQKEWLDELQCVSIDPEKIHNKESYHAALVNLMQKFKRKRGWLFAKDKKGNKLFYNGKYWQNLDEEEIICFLSNLFMKMGLVGQFALNSTFVKGVISSIDIHGFFSKLRVSNKTLINCTNGTVVVDEIGARLENFDPKNGLTYVLDFDYDPNATNDEFEKYLGRAQPNVGTRMTLQQSLGYGITKDLKLELTTFLAGGGADGKSTFIEVVQRTLGDDLVTNYSLDSLIDIKGYHRAELDGKYLNFSTDINFNIKDTGMYKKLASGEPVEARHIRKDPFIMTDYAKMMFSFNPSSSTKIEHTHGFLRRANLIPFSVTIPKVEQDPDLHKKILSAGKAGILKWIIEGAVAVYKNRSIFISEDCKAFKENFVKDLNSSLQFVEHVNLQPSTNDSEKIRVKDLYEKYETFCKEEKEEKLTKKAFNSELRKLGFVSKKTNGVVVWLAKFNVTVEEK